MRLCESYRCKRLALGLTQAELARMVGVSAGTISRFESGEELSETVFNQIRFGVEHFMRNMERHEYIETRILEGAYALRIETDREKRMLILNHMMIHAGKMNMDLLKMRTDYEEEP